jgi:hypothetical protein
VYRAMKDEQTINTVAIMVTLAFIALTVLLLT